MISDATTQPQGRKPTGTLIWTKDGWAGRVPVVVGYVDGKPVREKRWFPLGTTNKSVARRKLNKIVADLAAGALPTAEQTKAVETVDSFAGTWLDARDKRGLPSAANERRYYERVWRSAIGHLRLDEVAASHVQSVLDAAAAGRIVKLKRNSDAPDERYSRESIMHMRATMLRMFEAAWREELIPENRVKRTQVPELDETKKARTVLTDREIGQLVAHPEVDGETKVLVLLGRTIGGLRTGDLNRLDWTAFGPEFTT